MASEPPKPSGIPGWGEQPAPADTPSPAGPPSSPPPSTAAPGSGAIPGWGQQPATPPPAPASPAQTPGSGAVPGWGQPAAPVTPAAPGMPPAPPPPGSPTPPATQPGWGAQPAAGAQPGWGAQPAVGTPAPVTPPAGGPPGTWNPQPAQASGASGCLKIALILAAIGGVLLILLVAALVILGNKLAESVGLDENGNVGQACSFLSDADLQSVVGGDAQALKLSGLLDVSLGLVLDKRVLTDADDCYISGTGNAAIGRVARYQGGDAAARFQLEREAAQPVTEDKGNGLSVTNEGYFAGDVQGVGDEAFCTGFSAGVQAGVLVRRGDTLAYVSLTGPTNQAVTDMQAAENGVIYSPTICQEAQQVAAKILK